MYATLDIIKNSKHSGKIIGVHQKIDGIAMGKFPGIYREYRLRMNEASLMDYDDQMIYAYRMLNEYNDAGNA